VSQRLFKEYAFNNTFFLAFSRFIINTLLVHTFLTLFSHLFVTFYNEEFFILCYVMIQNWLIVPNYSLFKSTSLCRDKMMGGIVSIIFATSGIKNSFFRNIGQDNNNASYTDS